MMPSAWLRWGPMRAAIAAVALSVVLMLYALSRAVQITDVPAGVLPVLPNTAALVAPPPPTAINIVAVVNRDVFDPARSAPTNRYLLASEISEPEAPAAALPRLVVLGIGLASGGRSFATCQVGAEPARIVRVGDKIGPYTIKAIESKRVTIMLPTGAVETIPALNSVSGN
ncbi:MAG: hypothetical protein H7Z40_03785 [Phycisphaerae bacterium]|nr:hypothetical protein [Gemmatimonadaceae bacterium]